MLHFEQLVFDDSRHGARRFLRTFVPVGRPVRPVCHQRRPGCLQKSHPTGTLTSTAP